MFERNLSIKQLNRICLITIILIVGICGYLAISQLTKKKQQFRVEKEILSKRMNETSLASANLKDLKTALAETQTELSYLNQKIPAAGGIGEFLKQINALMTQRTVNMIGVRPLDTTQEKNYLKIPIQLRFTGSFEHIYYLLRDIEGMKRIVIMDQMELSKPENLTPCQAELVINVFERQID